MERNEAIDMLGARFTMTTLKNDAFQYPAYDIEFPISIN